MRGASQVRKGGKRRGDQLRPIKFQRGFTGAAAGSVLIEMGGTRVLCTASLVPEAPKWRQGSNRGWLTAEYSMLPGSMSPRKARSRWGHTDGRGTEIQRLVGRVLRSVVDFEKLGEKTIYLDCDVVQADGGTRTAAINGSYVCLVDAVRYGLREGLLKENPLKGAVAAVSVGLVKNKVVLDPDYELDSQAEVDMNVAMTDGGEFVEVQGTGEQGTFSQEQLDKMLKSARRGIKQILTLQKKCLRIK